MENSVQNTILEQYRVYNYSKEKFIDRTFETNRFFMVTCLVILAAAYFGNLLTPLPELVMAICALGMFTSALWWMNVASYADLIKVKYTKVLEVLEQSLPKQPYKDEFRELQDLRSDNRSFNYPDIQKLFATIIFTTFAAVCLFNLNLWIKLHVGK